MKDQPNIFFVVLTTRDTNEVARLINNAIRDALKGFTQSVMELAREMR